MVQKKKSEHVLLKQSSPEGWGRESPLRLGMAEKLSQSHVHQKKTGFQSLLPLLVQNRK